MNHLHHLLSTFCVIVNFILAENSLIGAIYRPRPTSIRHHHGRLFKEAQLTQDCKCGKFEKVRVVGGWSTKYDEHPWVVGIEYIYKLLCGGTIINDRYVVSAAHCFAFTVNDITDFVKVVSGNHNMEFHNETNSESIHYKVSQIIVHPRFSRVRHENDISLVKLEHKFDFSEHFLPACLPTLGQLFIDRTGTVLGWGDRQEGGPPSPVLLQTDLIIVSNDECARRYPHDRIFPSVMCAYQLDSDTCQGDSGGPILVKDQEGQMVLAGIISGGDGCGRPKTPGIYTRVNSFLDWIKENTQDASYCLT